MRLTGVDRDVVWLPTQASGLRLELRSSNTYILVLQDVGTNQTVYCMLNSLKQGEDPYLAGAGDSRAQRARQTANCPTHHTVLASHSMPVEETLLNTTWLSHPCRQRLNRRNPDKFRGQGAHDER